MMYYLDADGKEKVSLHKSRLPWFGHNRPGAVVSPGAESLCSPYGGLYGERELTFSGVSGGPLEVRRGRGSTSFRRSDG